MFFQIDTAGVNQGKVGMWCGLGSTLGTAIRVTCQDFSDQTDAYVMGCALPINDMYGGDEQKFVEPDALFQASRQGTPIGITEKAADKDLETLFTYFDWTYTEEGGRTIRMGINEEQYNSVTLNPDLYADEGITTAYTESTDENGEKVYTYTYNSSNILSGVVMGQRMNIGRYMTGNASGYKIDKGNQAVIDKAWVQWTKFLNTGNVLDYTGLLNADEAEISNKITTLCNDYQAQNVPNVIKGNMSWEDYVKGLEDIDTDTAVALLQKYVDLAKSGN